ncbi:hypothetical protein L2E82_05910 [Cichorium intybus]|uniref:Uncharacterized protein n=1 Tax=Cichorium intybus TaxID=13427 RepID=A0ACB9H9X7_CICIN|nr:hypothetical protein L2E82_05910 [Cichorium intybus]
MNTSIYDCVCFAEQIFCTENCSCEECFSRPEHPDEINVAWRTDKTEVGCRRECQCVGCRNVHGKREDNVDMTIGTSTSNQIELMNHFTSQDIIVRHPSTVTNLPYIPSPAESSTENVMIGTSTRDSDMVPTEELDFMNWLIPQDFNARNDDMKNKKK